MGRILSQLRPRASTLARSMTQAPIPIAPIVHGGTPRLEELLKFVDYSAKPRSLMRFLDEAPGRLAAIMRADICSIYLREGDGKTLVLRGNVGFPAKSLGRVRLAVGEGITGKVVEVGRPISVPRAKSHDAYRHFQELGEERFPVFLAAPIPGRHGVVGALVVQRNAELESWHPADVERLTLLGALVYAAIRTSELLDENRDRNDRRRAGGGTRKVTLTGNPVVSGQALGAVAALRRPAPRPTQKNLEMSVSVSAADFDRAVAEIKGSVHALVHKSDQLGLSSETVFLHTYLQILGDGRFRERAIELLMTGHSMAASLLQVAREVTKHAARAGGVLEERARDVEDLVDCLVMRTEGDKRADLPQKSILVGDELTVFDLVVSAKTNPVGVVLSERSSGGRSAVLAKLLGLPTVVDVEGLFKWVSDGDLCLVDGDHGLVFLNPSRANVATFRRSRSPRPRDPGESS